MGWRRYPDPHRGPICINICLPRLIFYTSVWMCLCVRVFSSSPPPPLLVHHLLPVFILFSCFFTLIPPPSSCSVSSRHIKSDVFEHTMRAPFLTGQHGLFLHCHNKGKSTIWMSGSLGRGWGRKGMQCSRRDNALSAGYLRMDVNLYTHISVFPLYPHSLLPTISNE